MLEITPNQISQAVIKIGIQPGDGLLVHSAVHFLGKPRHGLNTFLEPLIEIIGPDGTLAVPTFNFDFANTKKFDPRETPSKGMGVLSEYVRLLPQARRTQHPMQSLAIIGKYANELAEIDTPSAFDPGSAFDRMYELGFKILLLGAEVNSISLLHYSEQRANVPYRYWKEFTGQVFTSSGWVNHTYRMFVRDLELNPQLTLQPVQKRLESLGLWHAVRVNYGYISACLMNDFVDAVDYFLQKSPYSLMINQSDPYTTKT